MDMVIDMDSATKEALAENKHEFEKKKPPVRVNQKVLKETVNQKQKFVRLPLARVKAMMKKDLRCSLLGQDAVFLVTKATEMFIEFMAKESGKHLGLGKRKTVLRRDVDGVIERVPNLYFLDGAIE